MTASAYRDPEYVRNRARLLAGSPSCVGYPVGRHARPVPATEADHRIPVVQGGTHAITNLDPMCRSCNARKSRRSDIRGSSRRARWGKG